jgi:hypothetical protein
MGSVVLPHLVTGWHGKHNQFFVFSPPILVQFACETFCVRDMLTPCSAVDQAIMSEEERLVIIRFGMYFPGISLPSSCRSLNTAALTSLFTGRDWDPDCMRQDEVLYRIADRVKNFAVIYVCDLDQVPDFKQVCIASLSNTLSPYLIFAQETHADSGTFNRCTNYTIPSPSCSSSATST